jgi:hypothetical protein
VREWVVAAAFVPVSDLNGRLLLSAPVLSFLTAAAASLLESGWNDYS